MDEETDKWLDRNCWRNKGRLYRYFAMLNICLIGFGVFVSYDGIGAFQDTIMENFDITFSEFSLLYSVGSWPNIVLIFFGGVFIDRVFGIKLATIIFGVALIVGYITASLGVLLNTFWCSLVGRFIGGLGTEFLFMCAQIYAIKYFKGKELSTMMCINLSVSKLGTAIVYFIADPILLNVRNVVEPKQAAGVSLFIVGAFTLLPLVSGFVLACMNPKQHDSPSNMKHEKKNTCKVTWRNFVIFPLTFWLIVCIEVCFVLVNYVFLPFSQDFFKTMFNLSVNSANFMTTLYSLAGAIMAPFVGLIIDKVGRGLIFSKIGFCTAFIAHVLLGFSSCSPYFGISLLSLSNTIFCGSIVPMIAYIIPEHELGTAYGVLQASINASYSLIVFTAGMIVDEYSYTGLEIFMLCSVIVGLTGSICLWIQDVRGSGILNMTPAQRNLCLAKIKESIELKEPLKSDN